MIHTKRLLVALAVTLTCSLTTASDWPTWRHDANRSAASPAELPAQLHLQWQWKLPAPRPAFPEDLRLCFDQSYEPVVMGKTVFVPSMVTDSVTALDTDTGAVKWKFFADGPVRFAPAAWRGKVYFVSDDGWLYCASADTGKLVWRISGVPAERQAHKILGNERLVSRWPARGGPVVADGVVYFAAGIFPFEGVCVCAVDAETGKLLWRNEECSLIKDGLVDHGARRDTGISPMGYLAVFGDKLIVPSGRALPGIFDRKSGKMEPYTTGWGGRTALAKGCWWACGAGEYFFQSGDMYGLTPRPKFIGDAKEPKDLVTVGELARLADVSAETVQAWLKKGWFKTVERNGKRLVRLLPRERASYVAWARLTHRGEQHMAESYPRLQLDSANGGDLGVFREPVLTPGTIYYSQPIKNKRGRGSHWPSGFTYSKTVAYDLTKAEWGLTCQGWLGRRQSLIPWRTLKLNRLWSLPSELKVHIKAGPRLYAGAPGKVAAVDIPAPGGKPKVSWQAEIDGTPFRMLVADSKLSVVTQEGAIYCFGAARAEPRTYATATPDTAVPQTCDVLKRTGVSEGYCLALGLGESRLVEELALQSKLHVIAIEPDTAKVNAARRRLSEMGLYGDRVHVVQSDWRSLRLPPYLASLTVSEGLKPMGPDLAAKLFRSIRPYGGVACLRLSQGDQISAESARLVGAEVTRSGDYTLLTRKGALPGSDEWTHESGNAGNRFATRDQLVKPPFGVTWFGGSIDRAFPPWDYTHARGPMPLISHGRLFVLVENRLHAADIYTGRRLWQQALPQSAKTKGRRRSHMIYQRDTAENFVAAEDALYVVSGRTCLEVDSATGSKLGEISVPDDLGDAKAVWQEVRLLDDYLVGVAGKHLLGLNRRNGELLWRRESSHGRISFAAGSDRVYAVDYSPPVHKRGGEWKAQRAGLFALDVADGRLLWQAVAAVPADQADQKTQDRFSPLKPYLTYCDVNDVLLLTATRSTVAAFKGATGAVLWAKRIPTRTRPSNYSGPEPPILLSSVFIAHSGERYDPQTGAPAAERLWHGMNVETRGCNRCVANEHVVTLRDAHASYFELASGNQAHLRGIRSGCTNSLIPAGGILNAPNFAHGCCCAAWPIFTSYAMVHLPEAATWTADLKPRYWGEAKAKPPKKDLLAHWSFDERDSKTAKDKSGNANHGQIKGGAFAEGKIGAALKLNGKEQHVELGKPPGLDMARKPFTLTAWVKPNAKNGIVVCRGGSYCGFTLYLKDGVAKFAIRRTRDGGAHIAAAEPVAIGSWSHLTGVARRKQIEVYVNGKLAGKADTPDYLPGSGGQGMQIGLDRGDSAGEITTGFAGLIDEVKVFSYDMSLEEVARAGKAPE